MSRNGRARTSGAANGSLMIGLVASLASARAAATIVAVAPTLEAKSQLSWSVRVMLLPSYLANATSQEELYA